ncbi:hypothetical protein C6946_03420 [Burkholderia thailandensis]|nr:hypothetical protein C6946_03420 [Burkholderia thailandensis]
MSPVGSSGRPSGAAFPDAPDRNGLVRADSRKLQQINQPIDLSDSWRYDAHIARRHPGRPMNAPHRKTAAAGAFARDACLRTATPAPDDLFPR